MLKTFLLFMLISFLGSCPAAKKTNFAADAPVKKFVFAAPFPADLLYQASPDKDVIVGQKQLEPAVYELQGFEVSSGKKLWQLPFTGSLIGQTAKQILIYEEKTSTVYFLTPRDGQITRKISPAPNPLTSKNSLETGMAFTDDVYLTTKALYSSIYENGSDLNNRLEDNSFQIGITAKKWIGNGTIWFVPPVKQILTLENRPVIFDDKVLIINANYSPNESHYYQIVSLTSGAEISRSESPGYFYYFNDRFLIETTDTFTRRLEPLTGKEVWRVAYDVKNASVSAIGNQLTIATNTGTSQRSIRLLDADSGRELKHFDLPDIGETSLRGCFLTADGMLLLNFDSKIYDIYDRAHYNYWVAFDAEAQKVLWRTDFESHSVSSLFPFAADKLRFMDAN